MVDLSSSFCERLPGRVCILGDVNQQNHQYIINPSKLSSILMDIYIPEGMYIVCFDDLWIVQIHIDHIDLTRSSRNGYDGSLMGSSQAALCKVQPKHIPTRYLQEGFTTKKSEKHHHNTLGESHIS
jgi:hypothetical protein